MESCESLSSDTIDLQGATPNVFKKKQNLRRQSGRSQDLAKAVVILPIIYGFQLNLVLSDRVPTRAGQQPDSLGRLNADSQRAEVKTDPTLMTTRGEKKKQPKNCRTRTAVLCQISFKHLLGRKAG